MGVVVTTAALDAALLGKADASALVASSITALQGAETGFVSTRGSHYTLLALECWNNI